MEYGCPVCNGLAGELISCPECGGEMEDSGLPEDYYGPYSPYENYDFYMPLEQRDAETLETCVHLFSCPKCHFDTHIGFPRMILP